MLCEKCGQRIDEGARFCQYCRKRVDRQGPEGNEPNRGSPEENKPVYQAEVKTLLKSGRLLVYRDRTEFVVSSEEKLTFKYEDMDLVAVEKRSGCIHFITGDGQRKSCPVDSKCVDEAFVRIADASEGRIARRMEQLQAQGVRFSIPARQRSMEGVLEITDRQAEFRGKGKVKRIPFPEVRSVHADRLSGTLDIIRFGKGTISFAIGKEKRDQVRDFVQKAVEPLLEQRERGLRERGILLSSLGTDGVTTDFYEDRLERKGQTGETAIYYRSVWAVFLKGKNILELSLTDGTQKELLTDTGDEERAESLVRDGIQRWFKPRMEGFDAVFGVDEQIEVNQGKGLFHIIRQNGRAVTDEWPLEALSRCRWEEKKELGAVVSRVSKSIAILNRVAGNQAAAETEDQPSRAGVVLTLDTEQGTQTETVWFLLAGMEVSRTSKRYRECLAKGMEFFSFLKAHCPNCRLEPPVRTTPESGRPEQTGAEVDPEIMEQLEEVRRYIIGCQPPATIAVRENRKRGEASLLDILYRQLEGSYLCRWLDGRQLLQRMSDEDPSVSVGEELIALLDDKSRMAGHVKGAVITVSGIFTGVVFNDSNLGKTKAGGLFQHTSRELAEEFARRAGALAQQGNGRVLLFIDGLDGISPDKAQKLLEAMDPFFACGHSVFVISIDPEIIYGFNQRSGEVYAKNFHQRMFQKSFDIRPAGNGVDDPENQE